MSTSCQSTSLKKSSGDCLKLAKHVIQHSSEMMLFLNYCIISGSAEALVGCGGKLQHLLIAYLLGNTCTKHYENPTSFLELQLKMSKIFLRHSVHSRNMQTPCRKRVDRSFSHPIMKRITRKSGNQRCTATRSSPSRQSLSISLKSDNPWPSYSDLWPNHFQCRRCPSFLDLTVSLFEPFRCLR